MARKPKRGYKRRYRSKLRLVYLPFEGEIALGTSLNDAILMLAAQTLLQDFHIYGVKLICTIDGLTQNEGPIEVGWADSELIGAEILEKLDASPTSQTDIPAVEHARRRVRKLGQFSGNPSEKLADGVAIWSKMWVPVNDGQALIDVWVVNRSGAQLTTGAVVNFSGYIVGRWK